MRYYPFGETRLITGSVPTDRRYTGQRQESVALGSLYDYGARFYAPALGRWLSPDTLVPDPANPQALNRYTYVRNRPLNYIDPSGHRETRCDYEGCSATQNDLDQAIGNARRAEKVKFYRDCTQGGGAGCPNVGEILASTGVGLVLMGLAPLQFSAWGYAGAGGYTSGTFIGNIGKSTPLDGWNLVDATHSFVFAGVSGGILNPLISKAGLSVLKPLVGGLVSASQYAAKQAVYGREVNTGDLIGNGIVGTIVTGLSGKILSGIPSEMTRVAASSLAAKPAIKAALQAVAQTALTIGQQAVETTKQLVWLALHYRETEPMYWLPPPSTWHGVP